MAYGVDVQRCFIERARRGDDLRFDLAEAQSKAHRPSRGSFRAIDFITNEPRWATLGIIAGPIASLQVNDFVFTWPVSLFIAFAAATHQSQLHRRAPELSIGQKRINRMVGIIFVIACAAYLIACRRLSLVTQWTFLCGFPAAVPALLCDRYLRARASEGARETTLFLLASWTLTQLAFAMYFAFTVLILSLKYELADR